MEGLGEADDKNASGSKKVQTTVNSQAINLQFPDLQC